MNLFANITTIVASFSTDLFVLLAIVGAFSMYVLNSGVKFFVLLLFSMYVGVAVSEVFPIGVEGQGMFSGEFLVLSVVTLLSFIILARSGVGKSLQISNKEGVINLVFAASVVGFALSNVYQMVALTKETSGILWFLKQSFFASTNLRFMWAILPILVLSFVRAPKKKKSKSKS